MRAIASVRLIPAAKVKSLGETLASTREAIELLEGALELDPLFAPAWAQLARACNTRAFKFTAADEASAWQERAEVALAKALDLAPGLAEAHFARGLIVWTQAKGFPHEHAMRAFLRALELDPEADEKQPLRAHPRFAALLGNLQRRREAYLEIGA